MRMTSTLPIPSALPPHVRRLQESDLQSDELAASDIAGVLVVNGDLEG